MAKKKEKKRVVRPVKRVSTALQKAKAKALKSCEYPLHDCLINNNWQDMAYASIIIARRHPVHGLSVASFLVDLGCLGVKDTLFENNMGAERYDSLCEGMKGLGPAMRISLDLAARIVSAGVAYAAALGFEPHRDFEVSSIALRGANPEAPDLSEVVCGKDGLPYYMSGPRDDAQAILQHLTDMLGEDGFGYVVGM